MAQLHAMTSATSGTSEKLADTHTLARALRVTVILSTQTGQDHNVCVCTRPHLQLVL